MRVGLVLPLSAGDAGSVLEFARAAEDLGFDGLFAFDHLFAPVGPPDRPSLEAFATLAAVGAITDRVTIGTLVARASLRPVGVLARQASALDDLSDGRFVLGLGTGDALGEREHRAFGLPALDPATRRAHLEETVRALRSLFGGAPFAGGEHVPAVAGPLLPTPRTPGGPPIWLGGASEGAVRLAAATADGWNGWALDARTFASRVRLLRAESRGREPEATWGGAVVVGRDAAEAARLAARRRERGIPRDAFVGDAPSATSWLASLAEAGASWAILLAAGGIERMRVIGERVLPHVAASA